ncbi:AI-2E family transporter [Pasteurella skyensis]|uniref:AI-2E family transporter n=1 Tax=Phocoenobacter skyensis TaxID=97481 RepID=A0AAJ6NBQ2_9PAST|nr:AI-2E family transporter [Pasteurella skyensis]MDP8171091.1 AI-2E family transporter [Pasteurella skyensis]MDP8173878.1 AI-2E family transporter [Pasteurella skyensis]
MRNIAYFFIVAIGTILTLIYGQSMLVQFIIASLLWFATMQLKKTANKFPLFSRVVPEKLQSIAVLTLLLFIVYLVLDAVIGNLSNLLTSFANYEKNVTAIAVKIETLFHIDLQAEISAMLSSLDIKNILAQLATSLSSILSNSMMILIYLLFIFLETDSFKLKISALFPEEEGRAKFIDTLLKIELSLSSYFRVKTLMSLLTGFLGFIVLYIIGVDSPIFWAFLIFLLNYIPTIGSLIATVFPAVFSLLQFGSFIPFIAILLSIGAIQQIVGNLIEPKLMGKSLNISPLVTIIALAIWGKLWGVVGMLLSVPITVIMIIILSQFKSTQKVAILLSEKGNITSDNQA